MPTKTSAAFVLEESPGPSDTRLGKTRPAAEHVSNNATVSQKQMRNDGVISASFPLT